MAEPPPKSCCAASRNAITGLLSFVNSYEEASFLTPPLAHARLHPSGQLVLYAEINRQRVLHTYHLVTLLTRRPLRRLIQYAYGLLRKRTVGRLEHLDVGQATILLDHEREDYAALDTILEGNLRELHVRLHPVTELIQVTTLERGHRLGDQERLVVNNLLFGLFGSKTFFFSFLFGCFFNF